MALHTPVRLLPPNPSATLPPAPEVNDYTGYDIGERSAILEREIRVCPVCGRNAENNPPFRVQGEDRERPARYVHVDRPEPVESGVARREVETCEVDGSLDRDAPPPLRYRYSESLDAFRQGRWRASLDAVRAHVQLGTRPTAERRVRLDWP